MTQRPSASVSVIMPAYQSSCHIKEALESIAAQTLKASEVIVVDDGSTDDTLAVASTAIRTLRLNGRVVQRPDHVAKGPGGSRNHGASLAKGDHLAFLDSDDLWLPHHLATAVGTFEKSGPQMAAYCATGVTFSADGEGGPMPEKGFERHGLCDALPILLRRMCIPTQTLVVRTEAFRATSGFHEKLQCYEDWWLALQLAKLGEFYFNPATSVRIRTRAGSLSRVAGHNGRGLRMSPAMYRDQILLWSCARRSRLFSGRESAMLAETVADFHQRQLTGLILARRWNELLSVVGGMSGAGHRGSSLYPRIAWLTFAAILGRGLAKGRRALAGRATPAPGDAPAHAAPHQAEDRPKKPMTRTAKRLLRGMLRLVGARKAKRLWASWKQRRIQREKAAKRLAFYAKLIKPGDLVFDVGANMGHMSSMFLELGARVVAFEPQQECYTELEAALGKHERFDLVRKALGRKEGEAEMFISSAHTISTLSESWVKATTKSGRFRELGWESRERVGVTTLDSAVRDYGLPAFVKIDVEGYEPEVLAGLSVRIPCLSIEFAAEMLDGAFECIEFMHRLGPTRYQVSVGESDTFSLPNWVEADEMKQTLRKTAQSDPAAWGDVYIRIDNTDSCGRTS